MKHLLSLCVAGICAFQVISAERRLLVSEYRSKMGAGWIGQMVGVAVGGPTEFKFKGPIVPRDRLARLCGPSGWVADSINESYRQDDLYVEMTFLRTLEKYGVDADVRKAGIDFANSGYRLWCANDAGRQNLRRGIAPPDSGHPAHSKRCNDIDYQIESDFSGLISPGLPQRVIKLGHTFGRLMNYGDGVWAGQFTGAMYASAFFTTNRVEIVREALKAIPPESQYAAMVREILQGYESRNSSDAAAWENAQRQAVRLYFEKGNKLRDSNGDIDVRLNGAMVLIGFLYGEGVPERTIEIATRCGFDSDCNPSTAAGVLFTSYGMELLGSKWICALDLGPKFEHTDYSLPKLQNVCEKLAHQIVEAEGGRVECDPFGNEVFVIPVREPVPDPYRPSWLAETPTGERFTVEEMRQIRYRSDGSAK